MERIIDDPLRTLAYGTDASFYRYSTCFVTRLLCLFQFIRDVLRFFFLNRLIPKIVVQVESEEEVKELSYYQMKRKFQSLSEFIRFFFKILQN